MKICWNKNETKRKGKREVTKSKINQTENVEITSKAREWEQTIKDKIIQNAKRMPGFNEFQSKIFICKPLDLLSFSTLSRCPMVGFYFFPYTSCMSFSSRTFTVYENILLSRFFSSSPSLSLVLTLSRRNLDSLPESAYLFQFWLHYNSNIQYFCHKTCKDRKKWSENKPFISNTM